MYFQRIDRAGKGHLTQADVLQFLSENGFSEEIIPENGPEVNFIASCPVIVDQEHRHTYFNERSDASDQVVRKIDYLSIA